MIHTKNHCQVLLGGLNSKRLTLLRGQAPSKLIDRSMLKNPCFCWDIHYIGIQWTGHLSIPAIPAGHTTRVFLHSGGLARCFQRRRPKTLRAIAAAARREFFWPSYFTRPGVQEQFVCWRVVVIFIIFVLCVIFLQWIESEHIHLINVIALTQ